MKRLLACLLGVALACSLSSAASAKTYVNGIDANYPPFSFVGEDGNPTGFDIEAMNWIAAKMGFEVKHQPMDWDGIIPALLAGKIDMVCSGMSISPERAAQVAFSDPYYTISKLIVVKDDSDMSAEQALNGKIRLGVQRGTNEHAYLEQMQQDRKLPFTLRPYDSPPMAIADHAQIQSDDIEQAEIEKKKQQKHGNAPEEPYVQPHQHPDGARGVYLGHGQGKAEQKAERQRSGHHDDGHECPLRDIGQGVEYGGQRVQKCVHVLGGLKKCGLAADGRGWAASLRAGRGKEALPRRTLLL